MVWKLTLEQARERLRDKYKADLQSAEARYKGTLWLLEHDIPIGHVVYSDRSQTFKFGWRSPLSHEAAQALRNDLSGFPYPYDIERPQAASPPRA